MSFKELKKLKIIKQLKDKNDTERQLQNQTVKSFIMKF